MAILEGDSISKQLEACKYQFDTIVKRCCALENVRVQELIDCVTEVPLKPHYQQYILKFSQNLWQCTTVIEFIQTLCSEYSNFIFYHLLEKVIIAFGDEILKCNMEEYKRDLTTIITKAQATECIRTASKLHTVEIVREIVIVLHISLLDCKISDIERLRNEIRKISYIFELRHNIIDISGDTTGTRTITKWSFPQVFCRHLQIDVLLSLIPFKPMIGGINRSTLISCKVLQMDIDGMCVFDYDPHNDMVSTIIIFYCHTVFI